MTENLKSPVITRRIILLKMVSCFLFFCSLSILSVRAQTTNPCGVKAVISPGGDSVISSYTFIKFQNASINATDYRFSIDWLTYPINTSPGIWPMRPGLTTIKLVAYNGACTDTAVSYYFYPGTFPSKSDNASRLYGYEDRWHEVSDITNVRSGGYVLTGRRVGSSLFNEHQQGLVIKTKEEGCVEWAKKLVGGYHADIRMVKEAAGGGFFILAEVDYNKQFIAKLDVSGNLQWAKSLMGTSGSSAVGYGIDALPDGGAAIVGSYPNTAKYLVTRLSDMGNIIWQKEYNYSFSQGGLRHIVFKDNYLYAGGAMNYDNAILVKIDYVTGKTAWTKKYTCPNGVFQMKEILNIDSTLLINIFTKSGLPNVPTIGGFMRLDTSGQVLTASIIGETYIPNNLVGPYNGGITKLIRSEKSAYIVSAGAVSLRLQPLIAYYSKLIKVDSAFQVSWVRSFGNSGGITYYYNAPAPNDGLAIAGNEFGGGLSANSGSTLLSIKLIDSSGGNPNASCSFMQQPYVVVPLTVTEQPVQWTSDEHANYLSVNSDFPIYPFYPQMRFKCPDYVDSCSYLKLEGPRSVCNLNQTYFYKSHKNSACGQPTQWLVPQDAHTISQTDSSVRVRFTKFGRYVIYGTNPLSCTPVQDSVVIIAESKTPPLNLGSDQPICPQNTITLHAGPKFLSYEWQDGSTDSLLQVNQPGQYWVTVADACNNVLYDTITISLAPRIPFSVGPDRTKCNNDTIHLQAPSGFIKYNWIPAYNISSTTGQQVIVNPLSDTTYTIIAEKTPGCFAYDTLHVSVNHSPAINLAQDTSFCSGDSVILYAGPGFQQYLWSNGLTTQQITVFNTGSYSVKATTDQGCNSYDTAKIVNVFNNPLVKLGTDTTLCIGSTRVLNPGNFVSYLWQNGNTAPSFTVTGLGTYFVTVTDNNHCVGSDTINITRLLPVPSTFLPPDTSICTYGTMILKSNNPFSRYAWSNGATSPTININQPGIYWLQVTDDNNCIGKDTMIVHPKDCLMGLYIPSAFTPNHDGRNDVFKPLLLGNIKQYSFSIYNRWGQRVFYTTDLQKGWDGRNGDHLQNNNVFVWICTYQMEGSALKKAKGTVTLIR